ncbi:MAG: bacteriohemerythrin [Desulfocapsaceae bacterium]|nr:bacteriohemerythrin [Desulfocapsaceae bacterium]
MDDIIWDPAWDIGNELIDTQHLKWVRIFNRLHKAVLSDADVNLDAVQKSTLKEILDYTNFHFSSEEDLMRETAYPEAHSHWRLHKEFNNMIYEKNRTVEEGDIILNSALLSLMKNWLLLHIQIEDQKFGQYLQTLNR